MHYIIDKIINSLYDFWNKHGNDESGYLENTLDLRT